MNIKTWQNSVMPKDGYLQTVRTTQLKNMQTEIDKLRAALTMNKMAFDNNQFVLKEEQISNESLRAALQSTTGELSVWRQTVAHDQAELKTVWMLKDNLETRLAERDAEIAMLKTVLAGVKQDEAAQRKVLEQAKEALRGSAGFDERNNAIEAIQGVLKS